MHRRKQSEAGFTLLEIALVILVAGILIAAVLSSRGISEAARSLQLQKQVQELAVAVEMYVEKVDDFPGNAGSPDGDGYEADLLREELIRAARRATRHPFGDPDTIAFRINMAAAIQPFDADFSLFWYNRVPVSWAQALDLAIDDGQPNSGFIRATNATTTNATAMNAWSGDFADIWVRY